MTTLYCLFTLITSSITPSFLLQFYRSHYFILREFKIVAAQKLKLHTQRTDKALAIYTPLLVTRRECLCSPLRPITSTCHVLCDVMTLMTYKRSSHPPIIDLIIPPSFTLSLHPSQCAFVWRTTTGCTVRLCSRYPFVGTLLQCISGQRRLSTRSINIRLTSRMAQLLLDGVIQFHQVVDRRHQAKAFKNCFFLFPEPSKIMKEEECRKQHG